MRNGASKLVCSIWLLGSAVVAWAADGIPDDAALEAQGARIGTISIRVRPIFDANESNALYRLADRLHVDTRDSTIRAQLLFAEGDAYSRHALAETERNLRGLRFIREPRIRPIAYHDGIVDLEVASHDVWTTNPGLSFGRAGGTNRTGVSFEELDFLGRGKQVGLDYTRDVDRSSYTLRWHDPNVWGSRWVSDLSVTESDDGSGYGISLERPFYSLDTHWAVGVAASSSSGIDPVYALGRKVCEYGRDAQEFDLYFGWSPGLRDGWAQRWTVGLRHDQADFSAIPAPSSVSRLPDDRRLAYPYLRYEAIQDDFGTTRNLDQIARTEDLQYGTRYLLELGLAAPAFGADRTGGMLRAEAGRGMRLAKDQSLFLAGALSGRLEDGTLRDGILSGDMRYYRQTGAQSVLFAGLRGEWGHALDGDHLVTLGGDNGLRGYPLRYQNGDSRAWLTIEERFYTDYNLFGLVDVGAAVFFDAGRVWGDAGIAAPAQSGLLKDIGIGFRLGNTRSALGNVLHLDLAFPLDGDRSISNLQFLVRTKGSF